MTPFKITPEKALNEALKFNEKLAAGLKTLGQLDDVQYGCTDKEAVYKEDEDIVNLLISAGANPFLRNRRNQSPMTLAKKKKNEKYIQLFENVKFNFDES